MKKKASDICVGIVGAGIMGSGHALYISESIKGARVAGIYDANAIVAKKVASKVKKTSSYPVAVYNSIESMLAAKEILCLSTAHITGTAPTERKRAAI